MIRERTAALSAPSLPRAAGSSARRSTPRRDSWPRPRRARPDARSSSPSSSSARWRCPPSLAGQSPGGRRRRFGARRGGRIARTRGAATAARPPASPPSSPRSAQRRRRPVRRGRTAGSAAAGLSAARRRPADRGPRRGQRQRRPLARPDARRAARRQPRRPADGSIAFAGPFRSHDGIVIIDHGGGWMSLIVQRRTPARASARGSAAASRSAARLGRHLASNCRTDGQPGLGCPHRRFISNAVKCAPKLANMARHAHQGSIR